MKIIILFFYLLLQTNAPVLEVHPNPGTGNFTVNFKTEAEGSLLLVVSDATGKFIFMKTFKDFDGEIKENININTQPKGVYLFEVEWDNKRQVKKVILQ